LGVRKELTDVNTLGGMLLWVLTLGIRGLPIYLLLKLILPSQAYIFYTVAHRRGPSPPSKVWRRPDKIGQSKITISVSTARKVDPES
jgi:hypothetical protein